MFGASFFSGRSGVFRTYLAVRGRRRRLFGSAREESERLRTACLTVAYRRLRGAACEVPQQAPGEVAGLRREEAAARRLQGAEYTAKHSKQITGQRGSHGPRSRIERAVSPEPAEAVAERQRQKQPSARGGCGLCGLKSRRLPESSRSARFRRTEYTAKRSKQTTGRRDPQVPELRPARVRRTTDTRPSTQTAGTNGTVLPSSARPARPRFRAESRPAQTGRRRFRKRPAAGRQKFSPGCE